MQVKSARHTTLLPGKVVAAVDRTGKSIRKRPNLFPWSPREIPDREEDNPRR